MNPLCRCLLAVVGVSALLAARARADFPPLALQPVSLTQIVCPVGISNAGDGSNRLFVCDQAGIVYVIQDEMLLPVPFLDIHTKLVSLTKSYDERGLLSLAFHPNFGKIGQPGYGKFYVFYTAASPNVTSPNSPTPVNARSTISEFQVSATNPNVADPTERVVLFYDKPQSNHNGGQLMFGPDGYLYISVGDGGGQYDNAFGHTGGTSTGGTSSPTGNLGNGQDLTKLLGKILRIDPLGTNGPTGQYGIPSTNPYASTGGGVMPEIYSYGMRNPWRFSFDDGPGGTNRLFEGDVGQDKVEEVNIIANGGNYGWRSVEGTFSNDATAPTVGAITPPIAQYAHSGTTIGSPALPQYGCSVIGGYVYRGSVIPTLAGKYVFADYSHTIGSANGTMLGLEETAPGSGVWNMSQLTIVGGNPLSTGIQAFGRDERGELYVATKVASGPTGKDPLHGTPTGGIYRIVAAQVSTLTITPNKDNSIYSDFANNSNALGDLYSGNTAASHPRRALLSFDVAGNLPTGAQVTSASLTLNLKSSASAPVSSMSLFKLSETWGEGTSKAVSNGGQGTVATTGDATWNARLFDPTAPTLWTTAGGTFGATSSATTAVGTAPGSYTWTGKQMATDVQGWFTTPASNFGWALLGDETITNSVRTFDSREGLAAVTPQLQINFNPVAPPLSQHETWMRTYYPTPGTFVSDQSNASGDGIVNVVKYAFNYSPVISYPAGSGFQSSMVQNGGNITYTIAFRRDPRATDVTYLLQTSSDLVHWTTIVQSIGGAAPTGSGFVSEADAPGESPIKNVTAQEVLPAAVNRFSRLQVVRAY